MKHRKSYSRLSIVIFSVFIIAVNGLLGTVLIIQSRNGLKQQMQGRMFDILNTAASFLDGDVLESLEKDDYDTPEYQNSLQVLRAFQESFNLDYIYGIRDMGNKTFTFTIDPDPDDPGEFGSPIVYTPALYSASLGIPAVDDIPYEDQWGRFYSAYVPVFDSQGKVGGIIAVDVEAAWLEAQERQYIISTLIIVAVSLIIGGIIVFLITRKIHNRLVYLNSEMIQLADEVEDLAQELRLASGRRAEKFDYEKLLKEAESASGRLRSGDAFEELSGRLKVVRDELQRYIDDAHKLAYTDALTGMTNRNAYIDLLKGLNQTIKDGRADFSLAVFDINGLKNSTDSFGHEYGDLMIITASDILKEATGVENLYRIGGDEFVAVFKISEKEKLERIMAFVDERIAAANETIKEFKTDAPLAISKGFSSFVAGEDSDVQAVFRRADDAMYADKKAYYQVHDRRGR